MSAIAGLSQEEVLGERSKIPWQLHDDWHDVDRNSALSQVATPSRVVGRWARASASRSMPVTAMSRAMDM